MMKEEALRALKQELKAVNREIDDIVLSGGRVGLGDPLSRKVHALRVKIGKLEKPKLPGKPTWCFDNTKLPLR
jgi:hypothetical protein